MSAIAVDGLSKTYRVPERAPGVGAALKSLVWRTYRDVEAVRGISFEIDAGEMVGFIGPNGAGKTTTLKMLSGLMYPTAGDARVLGHVPWRRKPAYLRRISMVLGNKSQMLWDIGPMDSFRVLGEIYGVPEREFTETLDELVALLEMEELLTKPVRNFSLGERMKCELVAGLLHRPDVLYLDEPTLIHYGNLLYDGELSGLAHRLAPFKLIRMSLGNGVPVDGVAARDLPKGAEIVAQEGGQLTLRVARDDAPRMTSRLLNTLPVVDLTVEDPPIEAVIDQVYSEGLGIGDEGGEN